MRKARGMLLGKFMPPHLGHAYLVEFALRCVEDLTVVVGTLPSEPIPGELRHAWLRELFPGARVLHLAEPLPQEPSEHPEFWRLWREALRRILPAPPELVFASEGYGRRLAAELGADWMPVDPARLAVPISARAIRADPLANWRYLPPCVRPYYARRVCIVGPESTGKSTLAAALARELGTVAVPEYARALLESQDGRLAPADIDRIARGQLAAEEALARQAERVLVCDTDLLTTAVWSETLYGRCPGWIRDEARRRRYDLTLVTDVDTPWVKDSVRYLPQDRKPFRERLLRELEAAGRRCLLLSGPPEARLAAARAAVAELLNRRGE